MPPRYAYWTIIAGGLPTAFRAADREELLPTFTRIKQKHPDAEMKWFARGKLWDSPESARRDADERRRSESLRSRRERPRTGTRGRDWRPGGEHRDPRQPFKDAKKARNVEQRRRKFERRQRVEQNGGREWQRPGGGRTAPKANWPRPRRFEQKSFARTQDTEQPPAPPRPPGPTREPKPREGTEPTPPPRPTEPVTVPPGPPERGRRNKLKKRER